MALCGGLCRGPIAPRPGPLPGPRGGLRVGALRPGCVPDGCGRLPGDQRPGLQRLRQPGRLGLLAAGLGDAGPAGRPDPALGAVGGVSPRRGADLAYGPRTGEPADWRSGRAYVGLRSSPVGPRPEPGRVPSGGACYPGPDGRLSGRPRRPVASGGLSGAPGGVHAVRPGPGRGGARFGDGGGGPSYPGLVPGRLWPGLVPGDVVRGPTAAGRRQLPAPGRLCPLRGRLAGDCPRDAERPPGLGRGPVRSGRFREGSPAPGPSSFPPVGQTPVPGSCPSPPGPLPGS